MASWTTRRRRKFSQDGNEDSWQSGVYQMDPLYGDIDGTLGVMCDLTGVSRRAESRELRTNVVTIREKEYASISAETRTREDDIQLYNAKADYACYLLQDERASEALAIMEGCLQQYQSWGSEQEFPFEYAKYYNHAGIALMQLGRTSEGVDGEGSVGITTGLKSCGPSRNISGGGAILPLHEPRGLDSEWHYIRGADGSRY